MFGFAKIKSKVNKKTDHAYLPANSGQTFHASDKMKQREDRHYQMISCTELLPCEIGRAHV